jgi:arylsulfatase A
VQRGEETMRREEVTLADALSAAGWRTGIFGKWHNGEHFPYTPQGRGFGEVFGFSLGHWDNYFDTTLRHNGQPVKAHGYIADAFTDSALDFISENKSRPFFCYVAFNTPHTPYQVPDKYFNTYKALGVEDWLACVYGMCANIDDNVGRLLARLDELKLRENTIVIYFSDNGPAGARYNAGMRGTKGSVHEGGSREPFFLSWPARFKQPRTVSQIAMHIDLFPTIIELCGVPMPKTLPQDGRSLVPLLEGKTDGWPDRALITQHMVPDASGHVAAAVRTQRYRLVREGSPWQLFDMQDDPGETRDIGDREPEVKKKLIAEYDKFWNEVAPIAVKHSTPIPVGYAEENPIEITVPESTFDGGLRFCVKAPNNAWLTNWTSTDAKITWDIDVVRGGKYEVGLQYLCDAANAGSRVKISAGASTAEADVTGTPIRQVPSPDRVKRTVEAYEMEWATLPAGTLQLEKGKSTLTVQAITKPGREVMDIKAIVLKRTE